MNKKCPDCSLINYSIANECMRCGAKLGESPNIAVKKGFLKSNIVKRVVICVLVLLGTIAGFYASLIFSADRLSLDEQAQLETAIGLLEQKGFHDEVFLLRRFAVFRSNDNWLNASVEKENAYAATNFPFEIVTVYPDFFRYTIDDLERAAILLHESQHMKGKDEKEAYEFVWRNRVKLGWTADEYSDSVIWLETRKLTREYVPMLFVCEINDYSDCTG